MIKVFFFFDARRENVAYASTCNTSGQTLGIALGYMFFILFESEEFCNKWLRFTDQKGGIITMKGKSPYSAYTHIHTHLHTYTRTHAQKNVFNFVLLL